jgi:hypothetical protein
MSTDYTDWHGNVYTRMYSRFHGQKGSHTMTNKGKGKQPAVLKPAAAAKNKNLKKKNMKKEGPTRSVAVAYRTHFKSAPRKIHRATDRERILAVPGSVLFAVVGNIPMNPGIASSFPRLSVMAKLYEKYRIRSLRYRYKNLKGSATDGNVLLGFATDTLDTPPATGELMMQLPFKEDGGPWEDFEIIVIPDGEIRYIRTGIIPGADLKTYDFGRLFVGAEACASPAQVGYLEVEYDIDLIDAKPTVETPPPVTSAIQVFGLTADETMTVGAGDNPVINWTNDAGSQAGITLDAGNDIWNVPAGNWLMMGNSTILPPTNGQDFYPVVKVNAVPLVDTSYQVQQWYPAGVRSTMNWIAFLYLPTASTVQLLLHNQQADVDASLKAIGTQVVFQALSSF